VTTGTATHLQDPAAPTQAPRPRRPTSQAVNLASTDNKDTTAILHLHQANTVVVAHPSRATARASTVDRSHSILAVTDRKLALVDRVDRLGMADRVPQATAAVLLAATDSRLAMGDQPRDIMVVQAIMTTTNITR
jgi:hypothetical protein